MEIDCDEQILSGKFCFIYFDPSTLYYLFENYGLDYVSGLEPVFSLFETIHASSFDDCSSEAECFGYSFEDLYSGFGALLSESSHSKAGQNYLITIFLQDQSFEGASDSELEDDKAEKHEAS